MSELSGVVFDLELEDLLDPDDEDRENKSMGVELEVEGVDEAIMEVGSVGAELEMEGVDDPSGGEALLEESLEAVFSPGYVEIGSSVEVGTLVESLVDTEALTSVAVSENNDSLVRVAVAEEGAGDKDVQVATTEPVSGVSVDTWVALS